MTTLLTLLALSASAEPFDKPIVRIVPVSEIAADGTTEVQMVVVAYAVDGSPITGMDLRTQAAKGKAGDWVEAGGGVYTFTFTPPKLEAATTTSVTVRGRTPSKDTINISESVDLQPAERPALALKTSGTPLWWDRKRTTVRVDGVLEPTDLKIETSTGTLSSPVAMGAGRQVLQYTRPTDASTGTAIITAVDHSGAGLGRGWTSIPLGGTIGIDVDADSGSSVVLTVDGVDYGPVTATSRGASFDIQQVPVTKKAEAQIIADRKTETVSVKLPGVPPALKIFPAAPFLPGDPDTPVDVFAVSLNEEGRPGKEPAFTATDGKFADPVHLGSGLYKATWTAYEGDEVSDLKFTVTLDEQSDSASTNLGPTDRRKATSTNPVRHVLLLADASGLLPDGISSTTVKAVATDRWGYGIPNTEIELFVDEGGGSTPKTVKTGKDGSFSFDYTAGRDVGLAVIRGQVGEFSGRVTVWQLPEGVLPITAPPSGSEARGAQEWSWR